MKAPAFLLLAAVAVSACAGVAAADVPRQLQFDLDQRSGDRLRIELHDEERGRRRNNWTTSLNPAEFRGLDLAAFQSAGTRPLRFAIVRDAGRLDCVGNGRRARASGTCSFSPDAGFIQFLVSRGIGRPSREQSYGLMALDVRRPLIDMIASARYATPTVDQLMSLSAVGVDQDYIRDMSAVGYRPGSIDRLVEFKALGVTPAYVGELWRMGYANLAPNMLVQFKALGITPSYVDGFRRAGFRRFSPEQLVRMKAVGVTPSDAKAMAAVAADED